MKKVEIHLLFCAHFYGKEVVSKRAPSSDIACMLSMDESAEVRTILAGNSDISGDIILKLARDSDIRVKRAVANTLAYYRFISHNTLDIIADELIEENV